MDGSSVGQMTLNASSDPTTSAAYAWNSKILASTEPLKAGFFFALSQGLTLVHFAAQPEPFMSLKPPSLSHKRAKVELQPLSPLSEEEEEEEGRRMRRTRRRKWTS